jgi:hypothetical protein
MIEDLAAVASLEGWTLGAHHPAALVKLLLTEHGELEELSDEVTAVEAASGTLELDALVTSLRGARAESTQATSAVNRRRFARGSGVGFGRPIPDDDWQDTAPTRGRRSLPRITWPSVDA